MAGKCQNLAVFNFNHHAPELLESEYQARLNGYATTLTGMMPTLINISSSKATCYKFVGPIRFE